MLITSLTRLRQNYNTKPLLSESSVSLTSVISTKIKMDQFVWADPLDFKQYYYADVSLIKDHLLKIRVRSVLKLLALVGMFIFIDMVGAFQNTHFPAGGVPGSIYPAPSTCQIQPYNLYCHKSSGKIILRHNANDSTN